MTKEIMPPHSQEAEEAVLGSMLIDQDVIPEIAGMLTGAAFYRSHYGIIFDAICALNDRGEPADFVTLPAELEARNQLDKVGGESAIIGLLSSVPTSINALHYARIVRETWTRRRLISAAGQIAKLAYGEDPTEEVIAASEALLFAVADGGAGRETQRIRDIVRQYIDRTEMRADQENKVFGVPTGFADIDRMLGGLNKSDLTLLAGRPGMGKTALALGMSLNAATKHSKRVAFFSLEMSAEQLVERMMASETKINSQDLRRGNLVASDWPIFLEAAGRLSECGVWINDSADMTPMRMRAECRRIYTEHGLDLVVVDYVGLMSADAKTSNKVQEISDISRGLKKLARELNVPVLALSQLNRSVEARDNKRPRLSDLRDSGSLEQDADIVMFIYRDEYYKPDTTKYPNEAEVIIAKHRHGETGTVNLYWHSQLAAFRNLQRDRLNLGGLNGQAAR